MKKILLYQWHSFMNRGIEKALKKMEIAYDTFFYQMQDWEKDARLAEQLEKKLLSDEYWMLFSVNFSPVLSQVCENLRILYVAWVYDSPMHIRDLSTINNAYTSVYSFDRGIVMEYQKKGYKLYHMPLAVDETDFQAALQQEHAGYKCEVSLLGKLYQTEYGKYVSVLPEYLQGYFNGLLAVQGKLYGVYLFEQSLTEQLLGTVNVCYRELTHHPFEIGKRELEFMMACEVTGRERYLILSLLSQHFYTCLYTDDKDRRLDKVHGKGYADYYSKMPLVFQNSSINLNISLKTIRTGIPLRILDIIACGGFVLTNYQEELAECFEPGKECVWYESVDDAYYKAKYYLEHEEERRRIAQRALERVRKDFTYEDRLRQMVINAES